MIVMKLLHLAMLLLSFVISRVVTDGRYTLQWMNPRNGKMSLEKRTEGEEIEVQLPEKGNESDWILIIKK